jgi:hypothetical protein
MRAIICMLLALSLVGCAVSKNPNPVIRYGANTGATLAMPGVGVIAVAAAAAEEESNDSDWGVFQLAVAGVGISCAGFIAGMVLGGTVGFFKWMFNGFENDDIPKADPLPEDILPPVKSDTYGEKL